MTSKEQVREKNLAGIMRIFEHHSIEIDSSGNHWVTNRETYRTLAVRLDLAGYRLQPTLDMKKLTVMSDKKQIKDWLLAHVGWMISPDKRFEYLTMLLPVIMKLLEEQFSHTKQQIKDLE